MHTNIHTFIHKVIFPHHEDFDFLRSVEKLGQKRFHIVRVGIQEFVRLHTVHTYIRSITRRKSLCMYCMYVCLVDGEEHFTPFDAFEDIFFVSVRGQGGLLQLATTWQYAKLDSILKTDKIDKNKLKFICTYHTEL